MSTHASQSRRGRVVLAVLALTALLTACGGSSVLPADEAEAHYDTVMADIEAALEPQGFTLTQVPETRSFTEREGQCVYIAGNYEVDGLSEVLADEAGWDPVLEAINPVLDEHGFDQQSEPALEGGALMVQVRDDHGAEFSIGQVGQIRIWGAQTEPEACTNG